ncbi:MAG: hypothetical protein KY469_17820 [Actinobacteria bacterium]|nr:hypothetical protein [Actinomycetota bacterium]
MRQATSHTETARHFWVFDRPVWSDGMFWQGLVLGLIFAFFETSSMGFSDQSLLGQALDLLGAVLVGIAIVGVVGGAVRWFLRGYRNGS